jgi:uncharacterized protein (DUF58 family)
MESQNGIDPQDTREILKKVARIEIQTRGLVNEVLSGEYHSVFKGRGMEFSEVREYQYGDDIRTIDWNVSARMGHPYVKIFEEERELTVMLMVDLSSSGEFGTCDQMKGQIAVEICAMLAFSAIKNNDKVGLILFTDTIEKYVPPKKGKQHVLRVLRELLYFRPKARQTNIGTALEYLSKVVNKRCVGFLVSDFLSEGYDSALRIANKRHDIIAISLTDPRERSLPNVGFIEFEDAETGEIYTLDTSDDSIRDRFALQNTKDRDEREQLFRSMNVDYINIDTDQSYVKPLIKFFKMREKRLS